MLKYCLLLFWLIKLRRLIRQVRFLQYNTLRVTGTEGFAREIFDCRHAQRGVNARWDEGAPGNHQASDLLKV